MNHFMKYEHAADLEPKLHESLETQRVMAMVNDYWLHPTSAGLRTIQQTIAAMDQQEAAAMVRKLVPSITWHDEETPEDSANEIFYALLQGKIRKQAY